MHEAIHTHLKAELKRLDLLLHRQILRLRATYQLSSDEFRGLYISNEQVDHLILESSRQHGHVTVDDLTAQAEAMREQNRQLLSRDMPWQRLVEAFGLNIFEQDVLLMAFAPEIDLKYETLFAYLNNDVTRKYPTIDLALKLFSDDESELNQSSLMSDAIMFRHDILQLVPDIADHFSSRSSGLVVAPVLKGWLQGLSANAPAWDGIVQKKLPSISLDELVLSPEMLGQLKRLPDLLSTSESLPMIVFSGRSAVCCSDAVDALCYKMGLNILKVDADSCLRQENPGSLIASLKLMQKMEPVAIHFDASGAALEAKGKPLAGLSMLLQQFAAMPGPIFLTFTEEPLWRDQLKGGSYIDFHLALPEDAQRLQLWAKHISVAGYKVKQSTLAEIASRFVLTSDEIEGAVASAAHRQKLVNDQPEQTLQFDDLAMAARKQSDQKLGQLAVKVACKHDWNDLVLPEVTMQRTREVAAAIRNRQLVYEQWGFEQHLNTGRGLTVLFAGSSGVGKTMTVGVIARDLGLDLYKVDLSSIVSKYIGETEKNLDRIFNAAQSSNAILFFDECDALFGKRSEVKDAHDRYANIETAYLLQKIEEHDGAVILATNLSNNMDKAFSRRIHYRIDFPMPDEPCRERLWRGMTNNQAPIDESVDYIFLAKQFEFTGGDIRNVVLDAAFMAAENGKIMNMGTMVQAVARQMIKQGKPPSATDFKEYHPLITGARDRSV